MTKDDFERKRYDKEPVFDENYHIKDIERIRESMFLSIY